MTRLTPPRFLAVATLALLAACSAGGTDGTAATTEASSTTAAPTTEPAESTTEPTGTPDVTEPECLEDEAVGEVVGTSVEHTTSFSVRASTEGTAYTTVGCQYTLGPDEGNVTIGRIETDDAGADSIYADMGSNASDDAASDGFSSIEGLGDDAVHDGPQVIVLSGDHLVFVEFETDFDGEADELLDALDDAEELAGSVVAGLDPTVPTSKLCDAATAAVDEDLEVTDTTPSGGTIAIDEVTIDIDGCSLDLDDGRTLEIGVADSKDWDAFVEAKSNSMFATSFRRISIGEFSAFDDGSSLIVNDAERPLEVVTDGLDISTEAAAELRVALAELALSA